MLPVPPARLQLANLPTPLRKLERLSASKGKNIWLKSDDQSGFVLGGNKVRKLEFLLADAQAKGASHVITCGGVQSNHCRATAFACAQLGLKCHLILRNDPGFEGKDSSGQANHFLDQLCGASFELHESNNYGLKLDQLTADAVSRFHSAGHTAYTIPTGGSNGLGLWAYVLAYNEIVSQCAEHHFQPDLIVCATGSGGTQAGLSLGQNLSSLAINITAFAVCDNANYFERKVQGDIKSWCLDNGMALDKAAKFSSGVGINTNDRYIGPGYAKPYPELYDCIETMAKMEGLLLDPVYTGKAFFGLLSELDSGAYQGYKNIVFVHTGGGFGLFPHAPRFTSQ